jgi:hypothetical protein
MLTEEEVANAPIIVRVASFLCIPAPWQQQWFSGNIFSIELVRERSLRFYGLDAFLVQKGELHDERDLEIALFHASAAIIRMNMHDVKELQKFFKACG